jgi:ribonuclease HII
VAGVDEAGRGPLAGPVVAAAVILNPDEKFDGVADSKKLDHSSREFLFKVIMCRAEAVGVGLLEPPDIDRHNIFNASMKAMTAAVNAISPAPDFLLIDGPHCPPLTLPQKPLVRGDDRCLSIGAASIVAKVIRDRLMRVYDRRYPGYGFAENKGYGTSFHLEAIGRLGPTAIHRRSFRWGEEGG